VEACHYLYEQVNVENNIFEPHHSMSLSNSRRKRLRFEKRVSDLIAIQSTAIL